MWKSLLGRNDSPQVLESLDLPGIAKYIKSDACKNIFVMAGAGISTSAGIPDFRSPETGLYANLERLNLPYPEAVFDIGFFRRDPRPFYVLAHELAPGKFRPTPTHSFIRLLADKGYLHTCFTQNIDTLERVAGVPPNKIIEAHGSFADQHCIECGARYPERKIKAKIKSQEIPVCEKRKCGGYVKPDIVFFGESLPANFFAGIQHLRKADLLIVMGTSLTVHPFASLTEVVSEDCPRLLLNLDHVGGWGSRPNDVACLLPCDKAVRELCQLLGWKDDLEKLWAQTELPKEVIEVPKDDKEDEWEDEEDGVEQIREGEKEGGEGEEESILEDNGETTTGLEEKIGVTTLKDVVDKIAERIESVRLEEGGDNADRDFTHKKNEGKISHDSHEKDEGEVNTVEKCAPENNNLGNAEIESVKSADIPNDKEDHLSKSSTPSLAGKPDDTLPNSERDGDQDKES